LPENATLVVYMAGRDLGRIAGELMAAGVKTATPCCAVSHVATAGQNHAACRLVDFAGLVCGPAPLLLLIGRAMESLVSGELGQAPESVLALVSAQNMTKTQ
jgi:uroporphyrin-III C-methyltransferase